MWARSSLKCHAQADRFINLAIIVVKRHYLFSLSLSLSLSRLAGMQSNKLKFARMLRNHPRAVEYVSASRERAPQILKTKPLARET